MKVTKRDVIYWIIGNLFCMLGIAFATKSDFGLSMIAAGPYILHVALRDALPWFTQGTSEYFYEALVLIVTCIIIKCFKARYLLSFAEAFLAGLILDGWFSLMGGNAPWPSLGGRIISFILSLFITSFGVAFFFKTKCPLQTYDLAVVEIASTYNLPQEKVKRWNDYIMLGVSLVLSLTLTRRLTGIGIGTVITTVLNSILIGFWSRRIDIFVDRRFPEK